MMNNRKFRIGLFLTISLIWSLIWFSQKHLLSDFISRNLPVSILIGLIPTFGILLGVLITRNKLPKRQMSLMGANFYMTLLFVSVPIICLTLFGVDNSFNIQPNLFGLMISMFTMVYALFEEIGWRGYLQEEFMEKSQKWFGYVFIGFIWYLWHWYFLREGNNPKLIMLPILIASSIGIGEIARITKTILICAAVHSLVNMMIIYSLIANNITENARLTTLIACLIIWIPLIIIKNRNNNKILPPTTAKIA